MKQLTLSMFKPDAFEETGVKNKVQEVFFEELKKNDLEVVIVGAKFNFTLDLLEAHYGHTKKYGEGIFEGLKEYFMPSSENAVAECQAMIIYGEEAISKVRKIIGPTRNAKEGIRATSESAFKDSSKNYIHSSGLAKEGDAYKEVKEEILRFFTKEYPEISQDKKFADFFGTNE